MSSEIFSIGHSTHSIERFLELLAQHGIQLLADIRRFPGSRKYPHFGQDSLSRSLNEAGVGYDWMESLGGRRKASTDAPSQNTGLRNESFRNYADYMATPTFKKGIQRLLDSASSHRVAMMCSESVFWRCHRGLVSDYLLTQGVVVMHIMPDGDLRPHTLTSGAKVENGQVAYPPQESDQGVLF